MLFEDISKEGFELTLRLASQKLSAMKMEEICRHSGASYINEQSLLISYLNEPYQVLVPTGEVFRANKEENVPLKDQILILHYLTQAKGVPLSNKLITYGQIEGAKFYTPIFKKRNLEPLLQCFGHRPELLLELAQKFGGRRAPYGDLAVNLNPFPRISIFFILWRGDEEFPANGNILFDGNIGHYLTSEDVCVLTETLVWKLVRMA